MSGTRRLRTRLLVSHLVAVAAGAIALLLTANRLAPSLLDRHVQEMQPMTGSMMSHEVVAEFERNALRGFSEALLIGAGVAAVVATVAALLAANRVLRPLERIRVAARRMAAGSYADRVPRPKEVELAGLADDVNALAAALDETETRRTRLISEVAHEMRTPLATIKGYVEGLVDGVFSAEDEVLSAIGRETGRIERLATDLSELSRSEEGRYDLRLEPLDLGEVVREAAERLRPQFDDQNVALEIVPSPALPVEVDRDRMMQVFTNVVGNALTYTAPGGTVTIRGDMRSQDAKVRVTDTGRGLEPDQLEAVFERFYRVDRSAPGGTGIGLTIARGIARRHGGEIEATSPGPGRGSTFTVVVPGRRP